MSGGEPTSLVSGSISTPDGVAFDWVHSNLYWTDTGHNSISVMSLSEKGNYQKTLFNENMDEPRAIVVDPRDGQGYMYWSDWGTNAKIEKAGLDGTHRTALVSEEAEIKWPNGLTIGEPL